MRDIVKWLEERIMRRISMKAPREAELNSLLNGRGCHIIEVILWTFLAQSAALTAEELQQSRGRKAACTTRQHFTFLMRVGAQRTTWRSCVSPGPAIMMLHTRGVGSRTLNHTEGAVPTDKLGAGSRGRWRGLWQPAPWCLFPQNLSNWSGGYEPWGQHYWPSVWLQSVKV